MNVASRGLVLYSATASASATSASNFRPDRIKIAEPATARRGGFIDPRRGLWQRSPTGRLQPVLYRNPSTQGLAMPHPPNPRKTSSRRESSHSKIAPPSTPSSSRQSGTSDLGRRVTAHGRSMKTPDPRTT